jgi:hypothetical protein
VFNKWVYLGKLAKMGYLVEAPGEYSGVQATSENAVLPGAQRHDGKRRRSAGVRDVLEITSY